MALESFRFLHASDFHLDERPRGFVDLQDGLIDHLCDATYRAVDSVFDTALRERVDFVLLSGDILHFPTASPRAVEFLTVQFERLHEKKIPIYWLGGDLEAGAAIPKELRLPPNVHRMATSRVQTLEIKRERTTIGYVVGQSSGDHGFANLEDMRVPRDGRFFVGMWYCQDPDSLSLEQLDDLGIDYWAFGGHHSQKTLSTVIPSQYCGTPQGRSPDEQGPHGCLLVKVTGDQIDDSLLVETDALRYRTERIELTATDDRGSLLNRMKSRLETIRQEHTPQTPLLVTWEVVGEGALGRALRDPQEHESFLYQLRSEGAAANHKHVWTIGLRSVRGMLPAQWYDEDTLVGDFLRAVRTLEDSGVSLTELEAYLPHTPTADCIREALHSTSPEWRDRLLRDVTTLGVDLLSGETA